MTNTETATPVSLNRGELVLVTVSPEYFTSGLSGSLTGGSEDERTFYATASDLHSDYVVLVVPVTDPRHGGMWLFEPSHYGLSAVVGDEEYRGWNVEKRYVSLVENATRPRIETDASVRATLPVKEAYPIGSVWNHFIAGRAVVTDYPPAMPEYVTVRNNEGQTQEWVRGALDNHGTFVGWDGDVQTPPQEATGSPVAAEGTTGGTFTQEDIDKAVREAVTRERDAARQALEEFKETANARAVEYAEANDLCGEFERCMEDIGLMGREEWRENHAREFNVSFVVTVRGVMATDADDAIGKAREDLYNELPGNMDDGIAYYSWSEA